MLKNAVRSWMLLFFWGLNAGFAVAQEPYSGLRVAVFDVSVLQQKNQKLTLRCRVANTGRQAVQAGRQAEKWLVEFDTLGLPSLLRGFEQAIGEALRESGPALRPGALSGPVWLNVKWSEREWKSAAGCANLVFDTALVAEWSASSMRIRYRLRNTGTGPALLFAKHTEPVIKAYFVSTDKLTRGAIPSGATSIQAGRETLDGQLWPGQILEGFIEIETKNRTRFSPNVALEFDPAQAVDECNRTDNVEVIQLTGF